MEDSALIGQPCFLIAFGKRGFAALWCLLNTFLGGEAAWGGVHGDLNQRILVCLVQTHMVTICVHDEGYLNTRPPCEHQCGHPGTGGRERERGGKGLIQWDCTHCLQVFPSL